MKKGFLICLLIVAMLLVGCGSKKINAKKLSGYWIEEGTNDIWYFDGDDEFIKYDNGYSASGTFKVNKQDITFDYENQTEQDDKWESVSIEEDGFNAELSTKNPVKKFKRVSKAAIEPYI